jgi:hypothetical protein
MRVFGSTTKTQLIVLGLALTVLGAVGAFGVMFLPNETPGSVIATPDKGQYYSGVAMWAIFAFLLIMMAGLLVMGTGLTGLPFVHMAKFHTGVFYISVFSLLLIPTAIVLKSGGALIANAMCDTMFAEGLTGDTYSSPAGMVALIIGLVLLGLSVAIILMNLLKLGKVAYRPSLVKGAAVVSVGLTVVLIITYMVTPMLMALHFDHDLGRQGAVGFEEFDPQDVTYSPGWLGWLSQGEAGSTYGSISMWLSLMSLFILLAIIVSIVGFIGLALYSANDRGPNTLNLTVTPLATIAFLVMSILMYIAHGGAVNQLSERLNVSSEVTEITFMGGNMYIVLVLMLAGIGAGGAYGLAIRDWLTPMMKGNKVNDPISTTSLVDPPTDVPNPPTGWPANWSRMSTGNIAIIAVAALLVVSGLASGYIVKGKEGNTTGFTPTGGDEVIDLDALSDEEWTNTFNDAANEGATRPVIWQPDGVWFIKSIEVFVTWTDETPFFRHENLPDVFEASINSSTGQGASNIGQSTPTTLTGEVRTSITFDNYILMTELPGIELPPEVVKGDITINVTCIEAGDQEPVGTGFLIFPDDGNSYAAKIIIDYKKYERNA